MQITGQYLYSRFQEKEGLAYTSYYPPTVWNTMIEEALIQAAEQRYRGPQDQKTNDELVNLITTNNSLTINNSKFYIAPLSITNLTVSTTTWTLTTLLPNNILVGQSIGLSGISGFSVNPNGTQVVTAVTTNTLTFTATTATGSYTQFTGQAYLVGGQLIDYFHSLAIKAYFLDTVYANVKISNASNTSPIVITFSNWNNFRTGDNISISGITGNTNANGIFYLKKINDLNAQLYSDINLQNPVAGNGVFGGTPVLSRVYYNYCQRLLPDEKISPLIKATAKSPKYEMADGFIKIYPPVCTQVTIDYTKRPLNIYGTSIFIDANDNTLDLTLYYNEKLIYSALDLTLLMAAGQSRDAGLTGLEEQQIQSNP